MWVAQEQLLGPFGMTDNLRHHVVSQPERTCELCGILAKELWAHNAQIWFSDHAVPASEQGIRVSFFFERERET